MNRVLSPDHCPAYVLAGGKSSRFGSDKATYTIDGELQIVRLNRSLVSEGHKVTIVGGSVAAHLQLGINCIEDQRQDCGPMMGVLSALEHRANTASGYCLVLTCDLAIWDRSWFTALSSALTEPSIGLPVCFAGGDWPDPFPALYHTSQIAELRAELDSGQYSLRKYLQSHRCVEISVEKGGPRPWSFNTIEELRLIQRRLQGE